MLPKDYIIFIPIIISVIALYISIKNIGYARINVFHSIQKLVLQKAMDCNQIYANEFEKYITQPGALGLDKLPFNSIAFVIEVGTSIFLIEHSLLQFKQQKEHEFFLIQFWIQIMPSIRRDIINYKAPVGMKSQEISYWLQAKESLNEVLSTIEPKKKM